MIHLANDPAASRSGHRPEQGGDEGRGHSFDARPSRTGHAWPFLSRHPARPVRPDNQKAVASDSGS